MEQSPNQSENIAVKAAHVLLFALSFFPILKEGIVSTLAILLGILCLTKFRKRASAKYRAYGLWPIWINTGFYLLLILSTLYSENLILALDTLQASLILLFLPVMVFYFIPISGTKLYKWVSFGFIATNFFLLVYFFETLASGLAIDRMPGLEEKGIWSKAVALGEYPYEFVLSKAQKHLTVYFETHKVYVSLQFLVAAILSMHAAITYRIGLLQRVLLGVLALLFAGAIIYTQAVTTVIALVLAFALAPFLYIKRIWIRLAVFASVLSLIAGLWNAGVSKGYDNKNTTAIFKMISHIVQGGEPDPGIDKRYYIFSCGVDVIGKNALTGMGVGDVQGSLNNCYESNQYVVAEHLSVGSEINTHNYYFYLIAAAGILCLVLFLFLLAYNGSLALRANEVGYFLILLIFAISLCTENVLVRMQGAFLFALFNSLFFLKSVQRLETK